MISRKRAQEWIRAFVRLFPRSKLLNFLCESYISKYNNTMNTDAATNGEAYVIRKVMKGLNNPVVFDVGANRGDWSAEFLAVHPTARIYAFEPYSSTYQQLKIRFEAHQQVNCFPVALGAERGKMELLVYAEASTHNSFYARLDKPVSHRDQVTVETIDEFCLRDNIEHIHFLKIDTEGHDVAVLQGAQRMLSSGRIDIIQIEYSNSYIGARTYLKDIFDFLETLPYDLHRIMPEWIQRLPHYHDSYENFRYSNYLILRRDHPTGLRIK